MEAADQFVLDSEKQTCRVNEAGTNLVENQKENSINQVVVGDQTTDQSMHQLANIQSVQTVTQTNVNMDIPQNDNQTNINMNIPQNNNLTNATLNVSVDLQQDENNSTTGSVKLSKNQLKKIEKQKRWESNRLEIKQHKKNLKKKRKELLKNAGIVSTPRLPTSKMSDSNALLLRVAIDLGYSDYMSDKNKRQIVSQLRDCYAVNRRSSNPLQLYMTNLTTQSLEYMTMSGADYKSWDVFFCEQPYHQIFKREEIVFLTADSPNKLTTLNVDKVYVIGGIIDHNSQKGLCYQQAVDMNISHAHLPISDYLKVSKSCVLTVNQVFKIISDASIAANKINTTVKSNSSEPSGNPTNTENVNKTANNILNTDMSSAVTSNTVNSTDCTDIWEHAIVSNIPKRKILQKLSETSNK